METGRALQAQVKKHLSETGAKWTPETGWTNAPVQLADPDEPGDRIGNSVRRILNASRAYGSAAHKTGIKSAPCLDADFMSFWARNASAVTRSALSVRMLDAWCQGWHEQNRASNNKNA